MEKRCNSRTDCKDKSDEVGCLRISPDKSYQKHIAPLPPSTKNSSKIQIEVSADIVDILDIDEKASIFQVKLIFSWEQRCLFGFMSFYQFRFSSIFISLGLIAD